MCYSLITNNGEDGNPVDVGALDNTTGRPLWTWQGPASLYSVSNSMSIVGDKDRLYLATTRGLYTFQASTGKLLWHALVTTSLSMTNGIAIEPVLAG